MKLSTLYIRFFRSFNFDYLRKSREDTTSRPDPWDLLGEGRLFFPFVRIDLQTDITTVVGANEAGKSQLLHAVEALLSGEGFIKRDFCRYSTEFNEDASPELPEFGGQFTELTRSEQDILQALLPAETAADIPSFHMFRFHDRVALYILGQEVPVSHLPAGLELPRSFRIDAQIPLPDSIEIAYLAGETTRTNRTRAGWLSRMLFVREHPEVLEKTDSARITYDKKDAEPDEELLQQWILARRLLIEVAGITSNEFTELRDAVHTSEGYAEALVDKMNRKLADSLNFRRWWTQDRDFALRLRLRDFDLVFTIRDRTGSDYTFNERSQGLKYFLSYFVQYLSHSARDGDLLLMDEPDAFLSNSGQQDLLRIFAAFAQPEDEATPPVQVVYVTHSPFLIDKNHAERLRVLEKGDGEEGTRVVHNAGRNHYEPLRSSLGGFVAETTFISSCNLMLEGQADPILLAGASSVARRIAPDGDALDLNSLTLVPCGGAGNVPYMVHLARGRDEDKPAVLVLVDADADGAKAIEGIKAMKGLLADSLVFSVAQKLEGVDREGVSELEDLVPLTVANKAIQRIARTVLSQADAAAFTESWVDVGPGRGKLFKRLESAAKSASERAGLERALEVYKVPFARSVVDIILDPQAEPSDLHSIYENFRPTLALIESKQREAMREHAHGKISTIIKRLRKNFIADHPNSIRKNQVTALLEALIAQLPQEAAEADQVHDEIRKIQRDFALSEEPRSMLSDPQALRDRLYSMSYGVTNAVQDR